MNIKDIAKLAGVSTSTVSKVLNKKDRDISNATREKVLNIVQEYQYVPYSKIRKNTYIRCYCLGVFIADIHFDYTELIYNIGKAASKKGYSIIVNYLKENWKQVKLLDGKDIDGIIIVGNTEKYRQIITEIKIKQIPCIIADFSKQKNVDAAKIIYEEEMAAYKAISYLIEKGHTAIGCVVSENPMINKGYKRALYD
ncbi:MAG: LacI family transcriptional regulator, partial [Kineothrix sp.]|nr:LacI family transcriptional regulator [Kineothrix sp.]